ncbi:laminin B domain-containing protein [Methyloversatilis discipulorum]|uniref:laminin B domain-containing protein n=1 Tax=Methyloversatilis discipulorum TaxID=1119528 RepID=UPI00037FEB46|nr:laminin B domain-containing protein [Methyloversatilis discipulorum]
MKGTRLRISAPAFLFAVSLPTLAATSTFDTDAEGWSAQGDIEGPLTWSATGGNPGGNVFIDDLTTGGVTYFVAPSLFLGNFAGAFGSQLTFDLMQRYPGGPNQFDAEDVILSGGGLTVVYDTANNPVNNGWTSYSVPLSAAGWRLNTLSGIAPTEEQFLAVLSNLSSLRIRAEYQTGADVGYLDNVALVPEPTTVLMLLSGIGCVAFAARRKRRAVD